MPPAGPMNDPAATKDLGRQTFEQAHCSSCHAGRFLTNNSVLSNEELGGNPARAVALQKAEKNFTEPGILRSIRRFRCPRTHPCFPYRLACSISATSISRGRVMANRADTRAGPSRALLAHSVSARGRLSPRKGYRCRAWFTGHGGAEQNAGCVQQLKRLKLIADLHRINVEATRHNTA